jgi:hypothetical protein
LNNSCDIDIKLFNKNFEINQLKTYFIDIPLAYDLILPLKREKFINTLLFLKSIKVPPEEKFFETLYSNEVAVTSKSKALIYDYFENNVNEPKAKKV